MQEVGVDDYASYVSTLEANPGEFAQLFDTILINVTSFRRDPEVWDYLEQDVVPQIVESRLDGEPIRIWSAGTASGEEAYTLAILLAEAVGEDRFKSAVKIYATDADEDALVSARQARYPAEKVVAALGTQRTGRFFEVDGAQAVFRKDLRRSLIFGRHDLVQDPPISRIDLLVSRNTLMYFTAEIQGRVLGNFHFALAEGGYLVLGKSEAMVSRTDRFEVANLKQRVFRRRGSGAPVRPLVELRMADLRSDLADGGEELMRGAFEEESVAQLVVDAEGVVAGANRLARVLFGIAAGDVGRPLKDLELSYRPVELRSLVDTVRAAGRATGVTDVEWAAPSGERDVLDIVLRPITYNGTMGVSISFVSVGRYKLMREELETSQRELESAYEELQSTVEELETTNEELQSTNEELETTNEELHSSNEELETMNEELQATNEELETANVELRERGVALDDANRFLSSILGSLRTGVVVLNAQMTVRAWNRRAEDLWGLRSDEVVGSHFLNIDIGLPVDQLRAPIRAALNGSSDGNEEVIKAVTRRGRSVDCTVQITPLGDGDKIFGAILVMDV
jgi:two-component system CheB/CheR fusion protein